MIDALSPRDSFQDVRNLIDDFRGCKRGDMLSDDLVFLVSEDPLSTPVPGQDDAVQILADDGVV